jgi:hypothetical protein
VRPRASGTRSSGSAWTAWPWSPRPPGTESGTYDVFNEKVLGDPEDGGLKPRSDYTASSDDNTLVQGIEGHPAHHRDDHLRCLPPVAAAAASIVLLALLLAMNAVAIYLRNRYTIRW